MTYLRFNYQTEKYFMNIIWGVFGNHAIQKINPDIYLILFWI